MPLESERRTSASFQPYVPPSSDDEERVTLLDLVAPVIEGWRTMSIATAMAGILVGSAIFLLQRPRYEAQLRLAAVSSQRLPSSLGGLASLAGINPQQGGLNASPVLIAELLASNSVMRSVGTEVVRTPSGALSRIVDVVARKDSGEVAGWKVERTTAQVLRTSVSDKTGLITVGVRMPDSALARHVANRIVEETRELFVRTARAQAAELKRAQTARVDSAERQLRRAEDRLVDFRASNRVVVPYSVLSVRQGQLEDAVAVAKQVYTQAITDREMAIAKELEETPAMVVVDPLPPVIPPLPGQRVAKTLAVMFVVGVFTAIWLIVQDGLRQLPPSRRAKIDRVRRAASGLPLLGRRFRSRV